MGDKKFAELTKAQLERHIRSTSAETKHVVITTHAKKQMVHRKISSLQVFECLRLGTIRREPEPSLKHGSLECRMERYIAGKNCCVIVGLHDDCPGIICVTVFIAD